MPARGPQPNQGYVDPVLSNLSVDYQNTSFLSEKIFPVFFVDKPTGIYFEYDKSKFRPNSDLRAPGQRANKVDYAFTQKTYGPIIEHALETDLLDETENLQDAPLNNYEDATENLTNELAIRKEIDCFDILNTVGNFSSTTTITAADDKFSAYGTADVIARIKGMVDRVKKATLKQSNEMTVLMGYDVLRTLEEHPQFMERIKYSQKGVMTVDILKELLGVKEILVSEAEKNTSKEGQTDVLDYIASDNVWVIYINPRVAKKTVTYGLTLRMTRGLAGKGLPVSKGGLPRLVKTQRFELEGKDVVQVSDCYKHQIIATSAAEALYDVL